MTNGGNPRIVVGVAAPVKAGVRPARQYTLVGTENAPVSGGEERPPGRSAPAQGYGFRADVRRRTGSVRRPFINSS
jgi:hypothetical protein